MTLHKRRCRWLMVLIVALGWGSAAGQDVSPPPTLQLFDARWETIEHRMADVFMAGYGSMWVPPPSRADSGGHSVGYDVFDRFDLGAPGHETFYGTEAGFRAMIGTASRAGVGVYADFLINHNGFRDNTTPGFIEAGGYPGFVLEDPDGDADPWGVPGTHGDFHPPMSLEDDIFAGRLAGLISIDHATNHQLIRHPVDPDDPQNIPAGSWYNQPDPANARFYPDRDLGGRTAWDPALNQQVTLYDFNVDDPMAGDAVAENAMGLIMRHARWMVQDVGVAGFRIDAAKHVPPWVLNFFDLAVFDAIPDTHLDGSPRDVFSFSEVFDGNMGVLQDYVRKDIDPHDRGVVGGNRDALDFPLYFAMRDNLTGNGLANDWRDVVNASFAVNDDGLANNGSQGVAFVASHDDGGPYLDNVAHAYVLMRPGHAVVYMDAQEFGDRDFPAAGRGDALGGQYGDTITRLVEIRRTHGRGNYLDRTPGGDAKEMLIFERENSALTILSNRLDAGFDNRTVPTAFAPGTPLIELTGNASDAAVDPHDDVPELLIVDEHGQVNLTVPRNRAPGGGEHGRGYLIYGPSGPQGELSLSNVAFTMVGQGDAPTQGTGSNATTRIHDIEVIRDDSFEIRLHTSAVHLLGVHRDEDADGDNAIFRFNDGLDVTGEGFVSTEPGSVAYGFQAFTDVHEPGYFAADGDGQYMQQIDATQLADGLHFLTVRAFRHRDDGGPAIFTDFRQPVYLDRLPPESEIAALEPIDGNVNDRQLLVRSVDATADSVHVFLNLAPNVTDDEVLGMLGPANHAGRFDRDLFDHGFFGMAHGNHAITVVSFRPTGSVNVQRFTGQYVETDIGAGLGDVTFDGAWGEADVDLMRELVLSDGAMFNPAGDFTGDGLVGLDDWWLLGDRLATLHDDALVSAATLEHYDALSTVIEHPLGDMNLDGVVDTGDVAAFVLALTDPAAYHAAHGVDPVLLGDVNGDGAFDTGDVTAFVQLLVGDSATVPEPATGLLLTVAMLMLRRRRGTG